MHPLYTQAAALTEKVIVAAAKVQKHFGIGGLESIFVRCLERELELAGHKTSREKAVKISYRGMEFDENLRYDLLVDNCLLVEAKACENENMDIWRMQLLTYEVISKPVLPQPSAAAADGKAIVLLPRRAAAVRKGGGFEITTYMKLMDKPLGLVINFGNEHLPS